MPTIKTKKEMNLAELIEWGWDNKDKVQGKNFKSNVKDVFGNYSIVQFSVDSYGFKTDGVARNDTFTVEVEEEITEKTKIWQFIELRDAGLLGRTYLYKNESIENVKTDNSLVFYFIDEDLTATVIWKNGKLVD